MSIDEQRPLRSGTVAALLVLLTLVLHLAGPRQVAPSPVLSIDAWLRWFDRVDSVAVATETARLLALAACYHLLAMLALTVIGRRIDLPAVSRIAQTFTPPPLRTGVSAIAGVGITAITTLAGPITRVGAEPTPSSAAIHVIDPATSSTVTMTVLGTADVHHTGEPPASEPDGRAVVAVVAEQEEAAISADGDADADTSPPVEPSLHSSNEVRRRVVRPGDHLWSIAESEVTPGGGGHPDAAAVERYWHRLVLANPQVEDPDLVFPGDVITLPPVGHTG